MPGWISASGPSREQVQNPQETARLQGIRLIDVTDHLARHLAKAKTLDEFSNVFPDTSKNNYLIGPGDVIQVSVWETPPAMLFGTMELDPTQGVVTTNAIQFPSQMVEANGTITMPFAGHVSVQGRTTQQIEAEIVKRLKGKAHQPQVLVRVVKNNTSNVTVVGDVQQSKLMPLTPKGEHLLDALASSGGVTKPVNHMAIQVSRDGETATMALDAIIRDPRQNILLKPGDVVTALFQPQTFSVLGATGKNQEIPFEAQGISLAQALARSGGLNDQRADARGVFIFRFEDADLLPPPQQVATAAGTATTDTALNAETNAAATATATGKVPVVYEINLRDPSSFFVAQNFPIQNHDVIYVANSPSAEFSKFLRMVVGVTMPAISLERDYFR